MNSKYDAKRSIQPHALVGYYRLVDKKLVPVDQDHPLKHLQYLDSGRKFPWLVAHYKDGRVSHHVTSLFPRNGYKAGDYKGLKLHFYGNDQEVEIVSIHG